uniref:Uncharacterized protein n=1 Tax=Olive leaf mottling virus TaxID=3162628 RepID=A0AAU7YQY7_9CLOS
MSCPRYRGFTLSEDGKLANILVTASWALLAFLSLLNLMLVYVIQYRGWHEVFHAIIQLCINAIALVVFTIAFILNCVRIHCLTK